MKWFVKHVLRPKWVAFQYDDNKDPNDYELGLMIFGVIVALYKGNIIIPDNPKNIRAPGKREFGESLFPV